MNTVVKVFQPPVLAGEYSPISVPVGPPILNSSLLPLPFASGITNLPLESLPVEVKNEKIALSRESRMRRLECERAPRLRKCTYARLWCLCRKRILK